MTLRTEGAKMTKKHDYLEFPDIHKYATSENLSEEVLVKAFGVEELFPLAIGAAEDLARMIISRAPLAVAAHKRMVNQSLSRDLEATLDIEKQTITTMIYTDDYGEAIKAFSEKRKPEFNGR